MNEEEVCCICNEHKKFLGRVNAGQKLYCMQCQAKITKEYGADYWKPCSQAEFFESMSSRMRKGSNRKSRNMLSALRDQLRQIKEEEAKNTEEKDE